MTMRNYIVEFSDRKNKRHVKATNANEAIDMVCGQRTHCPLLTSCADGGADKGGMDFYSLRLRENYVSNIRGYVTLAY